MKVLATYLLVFGLFAGTAAAAAGNDKDAASPPSAAAPAAPAAPAATPNAAAPATPAEARVETELQELRDLLITQGKQFQEENQQLKNQLEQQQEQVQSLQQQLTIANSPSGGGSPVAAEALAANSAIGPTTGGVFTGGSGGDADPQTTDTPMSIHIKGITLTPGGFMEGAAVWRDRALSADVVTPFNTVPFGGSSLSHANEFNASGRQSRIAMLVEGKLSGVKIGGYYETDFLGTGITSNYTESNSYVLRQRQFWAQAAFDSGWTFTAGQMWSLLTETKHGVDNRTEALPMVIDGQYHVGFTWARQPGFRISRDFGNKIWLAFSVENGETTLTAHGENSNFLIGQFGSSAGLLNPVANYAFTTAPDFVFKAAFEPGWGHYEIFGVLSSFRDRVFPNELDSTPSAVGAFNDHRPGGGIGANARVPLLHKKVDAALHVFGGDGTGRYGSSTLADVTVRPDGTLAPIHNYQALGTLEWHTTPKLDIYAYVGGEYEGRTSYAKPGSSVPNEGYGAVGLPNFGCTTEQLPGSDVSTPTGVGGATGFVPGTLANCTGDTRNVLEGTLGFWYRFYRGPMGTFQFGQQYSYIDRNTWSGAGATTGTVQNPNGQDTMVITSFRYILP